MCFCLNASLANKCCCCCTPLLPGSASLPNPLCALHSALSSKKKKKKGRRGFWSKYAHVKLIKTRGENLVLISWVKVNQTEEKRWLCFVRVLLPCGTLIIIFGDLIFVAVDRKREINRVLTWQVEGYHELGCLFIDAAHRWPCEGMFPLGDLGVLWHCAAG